MSLHSAGLHKKVSAIFGNVTFAKDSDAQQLPGTDVPKPPAPKPPTPSHMTPTKPKPKETLPPLPPPPPQPKTAPAKRTKVYASMKIAKKIPWLQTLAKIKSKLLTLKPGVSSSKPKKMVILVPTLSIILIVVLFKVLSTPSRGTNQSKGFGPTGAAAASNGLINWRIPDPYPTSLRDPMQFGSATIAQPESGKLIVKGIVYSEDSPSAVINDQILHQGDKILDVTVVKININSVDFEINGKKWTQEVQQ